MNAPALKDPIPSLEEVEAQIEATAYGPLTLDPRRERATPVGALVETIAEPRHRSKLSQAVSAVAAAQLENFPENLFWDFDQYLASAHRHALSEPDYDTALDQTTALTVRLMKLYGQRSKIRFRYVHDFIYGFDWARWVRREPETRSTIRPFGMRFLAQSESRGRHILTLIEADDSVYPQLRGATARNPFPFSREPEQELCLYRDLSSRDLIPVRAWCTDSEPDASRDFDALREARAQALGVGRNEQRDRPKPE